MAFSRSKANNLRVLVTGGAGFIGRWVTAAFLADTPHRLLVLDDLSNGRLENLAAMRRAPRIEDVVIGSVRNAKRLDALFRKFRPQLCIHLAAQINVQDSIDAPRRTFDSDILGTFLLLEQCRAHGTKMVFMSTCMVYDMAARAGAISEAHPTLPRSPYAAAKLAGEHLTLSYYHAYGLPVAVMRPFNTYGPFQKSTGEGGVVSIFVDRARRGEPLCIYGSGRQTRDLLYVEDCAEFVLRMALQPKAIGSVLNAATGTDVTINDLARRVLRVAGMKSNATVKHVKHIHPQSEIMKLRGDATLAAKRIGWCPKTDLDTGISRTLDWMRGEVDS